MNPSEKRPGWVWATSFIAPEPWELVGFYKGVRTDRELFTFICCSTMLSALIWFLWRTGFSLKYSLSLPEGNLIPPRHYTSYSFGVRGSHCPLPSMSANNVPGRGCCISLGPPWRFQQGADPSCTCSIEMNLSCKTLWTGGKLLLKQNSLSLLTQSDWLKFQLRLRKVRFSCLWLPRGTGQCPLLFLAYLDFTLWVFMFFPVCSKSWKRAPVSLFSFLLSILVCFLFPDLSYAGTLVWYLPSY